MREVVSRLLLQIDEAWIDHMERLKHRPQVSPADLQLEELLFNAEAWLGRIHLEMQQLPAIERPPSTVAGERHKA